ncbi:hypothetical protein [Halalkalicoccus jeotgali]|uniref:hypothetical protein n=1 Tax=Halalkalicoccus jeotgali TaxID=413810 RepID=UPI0012DEFC70|nr:hypothetical protein [Halalkalicoccus jeotgali]
MDDETKDRMDGVETVNWSAVLRRRIEDVLAEHELDDSDRDLARAVMLTERVYGSVSPEDIDKSGWDSAERIRYDRERTFTERRATDVNENTSEHSKP